MAWKSSGTKMLLNLSVYRNTKNKRGIGNYIRHNLAKLKHIYWSVVTASDIHLKTDIHINTRLPHPNGVVIHHEAIIGDKCIIMQQVTLGIRKKVGAPIIGEGVYIGSGAKILGSVTIGNNARIGSNAVVLKDVPPNCTAVGVPARITETKHEET